MRRKINGRRNVEELPSPRSLYTITTLSCVLVPCEVAAVDVLCLRVGAAAPSRAAQADAKGDEEERLTEEQKTRHIDKEETVRLSQTYRRRDRLIGKQTDADSSINSEIRRGRIW